MKKTLITFIAILFAGTLFAQKQVAPAASSVAVAAPAKTGNVLSELAAGIDPKLYLKSFDRDTWKKNLDNVANPMAFSSSMTNLVFGLSPEAFGENWAGIRTSWLQRAKSLTTYAEASALLKELEANLNPKMMTPEWSAARGSWIKTVDNLK